MGMRAASVETPRGSVLPQPAASIAVHRLRRMVLVALWAFTFTIPSSSGLLFADSVGTISRMVGGLAMVIAVAAVLVGGRWHRLLQPHVLMILLVGWTYVSILWSVAPGLTDIARWTAVQLLVLAVLVWEFARQPAQWRSLLWAYVLGAAVGSIFVFQAMLSGAAYGTGRFRSPGFNPGTQAFVLLLALPLAGYLAWSSVGRAARMVAWTSLPIGVLAILLTASRASLLILPVALSVVVLGGRGRRQMQLGPAPPRALIVAGVVGGLLVALAILPPQTVARLGTLSDELTEGDLNGRSQLWEINAEAVQDNELLGVGAGASRRVVQQDIGQLKGAHNAYLAVTTELGVPGLVLLLLLLAAAGHQALHHAPLERLLALAVLGVVVLGMMPLHSHTEKATWMALAFILAPTPDQWNRRTRRGRAGLGPPIPSSTGAGT